MDMQTIVCEVKKDLSRPKKHQFFQLRFYIPKFLERTPWLCCSAAGSQQWDVRHGVSAAAARSGPTLL